MPFVDPRIRLPRWMRDCFPDAIWRGPSEQKQVYLTFDDGPIPEVTPWVLEVLKKEEVKACFFCVGDNVRKYPEIYRRILDEGHLTGNHTFNHLQGIRTATRKYVENVMLASRFVRSGLFRPPHGLMRKAQYDQLISQYKIIMWDVVSCDYRQRLTPEQVVRNVMNHVRAGSVITFHDSLKSEKNLHGALPVVIRKLKEQGYSFGMLDFDC